MGRQNQKVLRPGRRRKRPCSPGMPSAPTAKPKEKDPHENDEEFTERYQNQHTLSDLVKVIELLPPTVGPALWKAGRRCPFKDHIQDHLRDDRASHYKKSLYPEEDSSIATNPSTDDDDEPTPGESPLNSAHHNINIEDDNFDVELEPPKKKSTSTYVLFMPLYLLMALNILPPLSVPTWPPPWVSELVQHEITIFKQSTSTIIQLLKLTPFSGFIRFWAPAQQIPSFFSYFDVIHNLQSNINIPSLPAITKELYISLLQQSIIYTFIAIVITINYQKPSKKSCNQHQQERYYSHHYLTRILTILFALRITTNTLYCNDKFIMPSISDQEMKGNSTIPPQPSNNSDNNNTTNSTSSPNTTTAREDSLQTILSAIGGLTSAITTQNNQLDNAESIFAFFMGLMRDTVPDTSYGHG